MEDLSYINRKQQINSYIKERYANDEEFRKKLINRTRTAYNKTKRKTIQCIKCKCRTKKENLVDIDNIDITTYICNTCIKYPNGTPEVIKKKPGRPFKNKE